jgi:predicted nucleotidyltransferase component of viral defense system
MHNEKLNQFFLVGGTALALQFGHRVSVDLDLFSLETFNTDDIIESINQNLIIEIRKKQEKNLLILNVTQPDSTIINPVKVDFLRYPHPIIDEIIYEEGLRMLSYVDIAPMKLSAITGRGAKKDFYDLYFLLNTFSVKELMDLYSKKYPNTSHFMVLKSLTYFDDAENDPDPITIQDVSWKKVKSTVLSKVNDFLLADR